MGCFCVVCDKNGSLIYFDVRICCFSVVCLNRFLLKPFRTTQALHFILNSLYSNFKHSCSTLFLWGAPSPSNPCSVQLAPALCCPLLARNGTAGQRAQAAGWLSLKCSMWGPQTLTHQTHQHTQNCFLCAFKGRWNMSILSLGTHNSQYKKTVWSCQPVSYKSWFIKNKWKSNWLCCCC